MIWRRCTSLGSSANSRIPGMGTCSYYLHELGRLEMVSMKNLWMVCVFGALLAGAMNSVAWAGSPVGTWKGQWKSQSTGHQGPMRATIRANGQGGYDARFSGRFFVVIPFTYKVSMQPRLDAAGNVRLMANKPLGPMLGSYRMDSIVLGNGLYGSFAAAKDTGTISMRRVR